MNATNDHSPDAGTSGNLNWLLTSFVQRVPDVVHALAVSVDGLTIAASEQLPTDQSDQLSAITSGLASLTLGAATCLSTAPVRQTVVDMAGGVLLILAIGDRAYMTVLGSPGCDLGQVGYESALLAHRVSGALEPQSRAAR